MSTSAKAPEAEGVPRQELPNRLDGERCAAPGCPRPSRINRIFCGRHWQMVPRPEQLVLRKILYKWARRKSGELKTEYKLALENALAAILAQEKAFIDERHVQAFLERMQVVAQVANTIAKLPVAEMHKELMKSAGELAEEHPDAYAAKEKDIQRDAGVLRILGEAKTKLEAWLAPPAQEVQTTTAESAPDDCETAPKECTAAHDEAGVISPVAPDGCSSPDDRALASPTPSSSSAPEASE